MTLTIIHVRAMYTTLVLTEPNDRPADRSIDESRGKIRSSCVCLKKEFLELGMGDANLCADVRRMEEGEAVHNGLYGFALVLVVWVLQMSG